MSRRRRNPGVRGYFLNLAGVSESWATARARATREGRSLRWVLVQALTAYGSGEWSPPPVVEVEKKDLTASR